MVLLQVFERANLFSNGGFRLRWPETTARPYVLIRDAAAMNNEDHTFLIKLGRHGMTAPSEENCLR